MDLDAAEEVALCLCSPKQQDDGACGDRDVNAVLDAREDGDKHTGEEDEDFEGRY